MRGSGQEVAHVNRRGLVTSWWVEEISGVSLVLGHALLHQLPRQCGAQVADGTRDGGKRQGWGTAALLAVQER